jgi:hypothetical protein
MAYGGRGTTTRRFRLIRGRHRSQRVIHHVAGGPARPHRATDFTEGTSKRSTIAPTAICKTSTTSNLVKTAMWHGVSRMDRSAGAPDDGPGYRERYAEQHDQETAFDCH